jgi:hypothetical protein
MIVREEGVVWALQEMVIARLGVILFIAGVFLGAMQLISLIV